MPAQPTLLPKYPGEQIWFCWDFGEFPEIALDGETVASAVVVAPGNGLTVGDPEVLTEVFHDAAGDVAAGEGVKALVTVGTGDRTVDLVCRGTFSGGAVRQVTGRLEVRA